MNREVSANRLESIIEDVDDYAVAGETPVARVESDELRLVRNVVQGQDGFGTFRRNTQKAEHRVVEMKNMLVPIGVEGAVLDALC